jgi:hypothetical protein
VRLHTQEEETIKVVVSIMQFHCLQEKLSSYLISINMFMFILCFISCIYMCLTEMLRRLCIKGQNLRYRYKLVVFKEHKPV